MYKFSLAVLTVAAAVLGGGSPAAAVPDVDPPAAVTTTTSITVDRDASELYLFEPPYAEPGEAYPATAVTATAHDCPAGSRQLSASLVQDGMPTVWATSGRGAGEVECDGGPVALWMAFTRKEPVLHPGRAVARFALYDTTTGEQLAEATRTVWIPR